jgi:eukaryotic-like serine/threonine-protein kinase
MSADKSNHLQPAVALDVTTDYQRSGAGAESSARRPKLLRLTSTSGRDTAELQTLLRQRLRLIATFAALAFGIGTIQKLLSFDWNAYTSVLEIARAVWRWPDLVMDCCNVVAFGIVAGVLWRKSLASLRVLRLYELVVFGLGLATFCENNWYVLNNHGWLAQLLRLQHLNILATWQSLPWFMIIVGYGTLIPNTGRRCALVVSFFALVALGLAAGSLAANSVSATETFRYLLHMGMWLMLAVAMAIVGSHRLEKLRREASAARRLGQYQLKERLGTGGMGEVYLAEHVLLRRPCAVKLIRPERAGDPQQLRRFEREVQTTATLSHPNTVQIFDYGHAEDGTFYYAMEYLPGLTLEQLVERQGPLPPARAIHFLRQLCGSLREAHAVGLIHRDIKPGNVMICERGGMHDVAKLLDFGLVRPVGGGQDSEKLTQDGALQGTPAYMSPEQAGGQNDLDARSDIYSVGAVAYFLLTGQSPFAGRSCVKMLAAHLYESPAPLTALRPEVPPELEGVILMCLAKNPSDRFANAGSLESALAKCANLPPGDAG